MNDSDFFRFWFLIEKHFVFATKSIWFIMLVSLSTPSTPLSYLFLRKFTIVWLNYESVNAIRREGIQSFFFLRIESNLSSRARQIYDFSHFPFGTRKSNFSTIQFITIDLILPLFFFSHFSNIGKYSMGIITTMIIANICFFTPFFPFPMGKTQSSPTLIWFYCNFVSL